MKRLSLLALVVFAAGCEMPCCPLSDRAKEWAISVAEADKRPRIKSEVLAGTWKASDGHTITFGKDGSFVETGRKPSTYRLEAYQLIVAGSASQRGIVMETKDRLQVCDENRQLRLFVRQ